MRLIWCVMALFLALPQAHAAVVISQVLYDPIGSESGGEAVELRNDGSAGVDIGGWVLSTETSASDATIPSGAVLSAGAVYLVADSGWSTAKDNPDWKPADHEETLTLANSNSGIALKDAGGAVIDAVGWGDSAEIKPGLWEGSPASEVESGKALVRSQDTGDNLADFDSGEPEFFGGSAVVIVVNVTNSSLAPFSLGAALIEDDSAEPGVQLNPVAGSTRALHLEINYSGNGVSVNWFGAAITPLKNGSVWLAELPLEYWRAPGVHDVVISVPGQNLSLPITIMELKSAKLETKIVALNAVLGGETTGKIKVVNHGNVPLDLSWDGADLVFGAQKIPFDNLEVEDAVIQPAQTKAIGVTLDVPNNALPGEYRTMLVMDTG